MPAIKSNLPNEIVVRLTRLSFDPVKFWTFKLCRYQVRIDLANNLLAIKLIEQKHTSLPSKTGSWRLTWLEQPVQIEQEKLF